MKDLRHHDIICFDVDSTLVTCEGVDWLAERKGVGREVSRLTQLSMDGTVSIDEVFEKKIDILAPTQEELRILADHYLKCLTEGAKELVDILLTLDKNLWLITGGLGDSILPLGAFLSITNIKSNTVLFDQDGNYLGVDTTNVLTKGDGKALLVKEFDRKKSVAFVGDSVTDLTTQPYVKTFVGYGGVAKREKVANKAKHYISTKSMLPLLEYLITEEELRSIKANKAL